MVLYFLSFVFLLSVEAGIDPLSWGLFVYALIITLFLFFPLIFFGSTIPVRNPSWTGEFKEILLTGKLLNQYKN